MRTPLAMIFLLLIPCLAPAQDDAAAQAAQAAQQAMQQAQQANQQAIQQMQQANQQASDAMRQSMENSQNAVTQPCCIQLTAAPKFSVKAGKYSKPTTVKITDATRGAIIYYTTDGWTPTVKSARYRGPILIDSTITLQAVAIAPYSVRSMVASAQYTIPGTGATTSDAMASATSSAVATVPGAKTNAAKGTPVHLVFAAEVSSKTASVGDKIPMALSEDLQFGNVLVKKGAPATVTITAVDSTGMGGAPGVLSFDVDPLQTDAGPIPLRGSATKEGEAKPPNAAVLIPVVGPFTVFKHGTDAVIPAGTPFVAYVKPNKRAVPAQ